MSFIIEHSHVSFHRRRRVYPSARARARVSPPEAPQCRTLRIDHAFYRVCSAHQGIIVERALVQGCAFNVFAFNDARQSFSARATAESLSGIGERPCAHSYTVTVIRTRTAVTKL
jgi:hypothetical protein